MNHGRSRIGLILPWLLTLTCLVAARPAAAADLDKTFPFELGRWHELNVADGPVTLHRIKIEEVGGSVTKSLLMRPTNTDFTTTVRIYLEYSNSSSRDWEADLDVTWVDRKGRVIDGYRDEEGLDDRESHDGVTVTMSTLRYGLDVAKKLHVKIRFYPD